MKMTKVGISSVRREKKVESQTENMKDNETGVWWWWWW
jgi:hypothetical protein